MFFCVHARQKRVTPRGAPATSPITQRQPHETDTHMHRQTRPLHTYAQTGRQTDTHNIRTNTKHAHKNVHKSAPTQKQAQTHKQLPPTSEPIPSDRGTKGNHHVPPRPSRPGYLVARRELPRVDRVALQTVRRTTSAVPTTSVVPVHSASVEMIIVAIIVDHDGPSRGSDAA